MTETWEEISNSLKEIRQKLQAIETKLSLPDGYHLKEELGPRFPTKEDIKGFRKAQKPLGREPTAEELKEQQEDAQ